MVVEPSSPRFPGGGIWWLARSRPKSSEAAAALVQDEPHARRKGSPEYRRKRRVFGESLSLAVRRAKEDRERSSANIGRHQQQPLQGAEVGASPSSTFSAGTSGWSAPVNCAHRVCGACNV